METSRPTGGSAFADQSPFAARFDWGAGGLRAIAPAAAAGAIVVVDVLSFGTAVSVAIGRGAAVVPCGWRDGRAETLARTQGAFLAVHRTDVGPDQPYSLSPVTLLALPPGARLVLPSPNGSYLSTLAAESGAHVLAGCLRNAAAVARAADELAGDGPVAVVAAGERRRDPDDPLRPAVEDLVGAGAILAGLGSRAPSPEARAAIAAFRDAAADLPAFLDACASGRELGLAGFARDVAIAAELDADRLAPVLRSGAFVPHD